MSYDQIKNLTNWQLKAGSHEFPGEGTCINEAAIVAMGFEYKAVNSWRDCPPCFCPVLAQFAIKINDKVADDCRQLLLPAITRLAGSKDLEHERARLEYIFMSVVQRICIPFFDRANKTLAYRLARTKDSGTVYKALMMHRQSTVSGKLKSACASIFQTVKGHSDMYNTFYWLLRTIEEIEYLSKEIKFLESSELNATWDPNCNNAAFITEQNTQQKTLADLNDQILIDIFFEALDIGKQADSFDIVEVQQRVSKHLERV